MQCRGNWIKLGGLPRKFTENPLFCRGKPVVVYSVHLCIYDLKRDQKENEERKKKK